MTFIRRHRFKPAFPDSWGKSFLAALKRACASADNQVMKPKFLVFTAWVFYLIAQRTGEDLWLYCMLYSIALAACAFLYQREHKKSEPDRGHERLVHHQNIDV